MIILKHLFITAIAGMVLLILGCTNAPATHQNTSAVQAPTTQKVSIISDPSGARIEINNDYVGDAPLEVNLPPQSQFGGNAYVIRATPRENGYVQTKYIGPWDPIPSRMLFQMNLRLVTNP